MKKFLLRNWKSILLFAIFGLVGGFFTGIVSFDMLPLDVQKQIFEKGMNKTLAAIITALQVFIIYGIILGASGIFFAEKVGLWKKENVNTMRAIILTLIVSVIGGLSMVLFDLFWFGKHSTVIMSSVKTKPSVFYIMSCLTYGAVIEEVMLRLFAMSFVAFIIHKIAERKNEKTATWIFIVANIVAAFLFAAGHLPATFLTIGNSAIIIFRCFLLNGGIGLLFGYLYRKYGIGYAMLSHGGCHIISKLLILFLC